MSQSSVIAPNSEWMRELGGSNPCDAMQRLQSIGAIGPKASAEPFVSDLGDSPWSFSLEFAARCALEVAPVGPELSLESLPFYSLCRGLYLPLLGWDAERQRSVFGVVAPALADREARIALMNQFVVRENGLSLSEKVALFLTDPFEGRAPALSEESLMRCLSQLAGTTMSDLRKKLVRIGSLLLLGASFKNNERSEPPLTSREVILCLQGLKKLKVARRREIVEDLFQRCGRLEAYCLLGLLVGKLHLSWSQRQGDLQRWLAQRWSVQVESLESAVGLRDLFSLTRMVEAEGPESINKVVLQPLIAFRPCLAQSLDGGLDGVKFPAWAECKYDGIRILVHKDKDSSGRMLTAAYTRRRNDWSELIPGLQPILSMLPANSAILDAELHGTILGMDGSVKPATVYEVHQRLRGEGTAQLRLVIFDILYQNGADLTKFPFQQRRRLMEQLCTPLTVMALPLPVVVSSGSLVENSEQLNRAYQQFRRQGHEGLMLKDLNGPYLIDQRSPYWKKKKPELSLELVVTGAFWGESAGVTSAPRIFDSYVVSCREPQGWHELGTVAGVDAQQTQSLVWEIQRNQLLTGRPIQYRGNDRVATGVALNPHLVVTVAFEGVVRDSVSGELSLRSPRIRAIRSGELSLQEVATLHDLETLALKDRLS